MKTPVALKLDFKIDEKGRLRIFDIGDGLAAGLTGFEDTPVSENIKPQFFLRENHYSISHYKNMPIVIFRRLY